MGKMSEVRTRRFGFPWPLIVIAFGFLIWLYQDENGLKLCDLGMVIWIEKSDQSSLITTTIGNFRVDNDHNLGTGREVSLFEDSRGQYKLVDSKHGIGFIKEMGFYNVQ